MRAIVGRPRFLNPTKPPETQRWWQGPAPHRQNLRGSAVGPVDLQLRSLALERVHVPADGSCQYHSVAVSCAFTHTELRFLALSLIESCPADFKPFIAGSFEGYLRRLKTPGSWGDHITLHALARILQQPIHVARTSGVTVISPASLPIGVSPLWVAYNGVHYDAVLPARVELVTSAFVAEPSERRMPIPQLECEGFSKRNPVCLSFASCNVTSLKKNLSLISNLADVIGFQESRHTALSTPVLASRLSALGLTAVFGKPMPHRNRGRSREARAVWNARPGGVAIACKNSIPLQLVPVGDDPRRRMLWDSHRWLHAVIAFGTGRQVIHVFVFYGFPGSYSNSTHRCRTEELLDEVFTEASKYRDLPALILADLNLQPQDSDVCRRACLQGGWVDAALAASKLDPTHYPPHGQPRRLDVALLNKTAADAFNGYAVLDDTGLPSHRPAQVVLSTPRFATLHCQLNRPRKFPDVISACPREEQLLAKKIFSAHEETWTKALAVLDVDSLLTCWSKFSEEFLCKRASVDSSAYTGRGKTPRFVKQPNCGVNRPIKFSGSQTTVEERCLRKLVRQIEELQRQSPTDLGPWPFRLRHLWSLAASRARKWD